MALLGQASGNFTESNSALRIMHVGVRNTVGQLTADAFTQVNPVSGNNGADVSTAPGLLTTVFGVLSGSIAFTRPDSALAGAVGGPAFGADDDQNQRALGCFINNANGNAYTNIPGVASNKGPYVSAQGTYGNKLYETQNQDGGANLDYIIGDELYASINGFITNVNDNDNCHETKSGAISVTVVGILKIIPDSLATEIVYDQRI
jgi:hypothetical protein